MATLALNGLHPVESVSLQDGEHAQGDGAYVSEILLIVILAER